MAIQNLQYKIVADHTPLEKAFRYVFEHAMSPDEALKQLPFLCSPGGILADCPEDRQAFEQILAHMDSEDPLEDDDFFRGDGMLFINVHPRYMPVFRHRHHFFELQYVIRGTVKQTVAGHELLLQEGDVCFIAPDTFHAVSVFDDDTILINILVRVDTFRATFMNILNKEDIISDFFSRVLFCNSFYPYLYCNARIPEKLTPIILDMIRIDNSDMRLKNRLQTTKLEEFFIYLLDEHEYDFLTGSVIGDTDKKVLPMLRYIRDHVRTVTLTEVAEHFNYSESYLSRIIASYSGTSFQEIVRTTRLHNAARLLATSDMPVGEISVESGYEDRTYFHKAFKKQYGVTPSEYRRQSITGTDIG